MNILISWQCIVCVCVFEGVGWEPVNINFYVYIRTDSEKATVSVEHDSAKTFAISVKKLVHEWEQSVSTV